MRPFRKFSPGDRVEVTTPLFATGRHGTVVQVKGRFTIGGRYVVILDRCCEDWGWPGEPPAPALLADFYGSELKKEK